VEEEDLVTAEAVAEYFTDCFHADYQNVMDKLNTMTINEVWNFGDEETIIRKQ
jgi:hypothetical protein